MTPQIDIWQWIAYALPGLGILLAWAVRSRRPMFIVLVSSLLVSQLLGMHTLLGLGTLLLLLLCALVIAREHQLPLAAELPWPKQVCYPKAWYIASVIVFLVLLVALSAHLAPGIKNILYLWQYRLGPDVVPMDYYLNFDKPYVALMLAMLFVTPADSGAWRLVGKSLGFYAALMLPPIFVLAMVTGLVNFDPKIPDTFGVWAYSNLLYTCVAEEILFRGLLLAGMCRLLAKAVNGEAIALTAVSILFGLAHFSAGIAYMFIASVAGLGYGLIYLKTRRIEASILLHFLVNATHILLFSYPMLQTQSQ